MEFVDTLTIDGATRKTRDGYLVADVRCARTGIQIYSGRDVGKPELEQVRVYRSPDEVFNKDSLATFAHRPVTVDHPDEPVTAANWRDLAVGLTGDEIARDGDFVRVPMTVMDADAIATVEGGKRQLSVGYSCDVEFRDGITPDGLPFDAVQSNIRANHLAIVGAARGGPKLKIGDTKVTTKTMIVDGLMVPVTDEAEAAINKLQGQVAALTVTVSTKDGEIGTLKATVATRDGEVAALKKQVEDGTSPAAIDARVAARAKVTDAAKALLPNLDVTGKSETEIKRAVVAAKMGDAAKDMNDATVDGAFAAFAAGIPAGGSPASNGTTYIPPVQRDGGAQTFDIADAQRKSVAAQAKRREELASRHLKGPGEAVAS